MPYDKLAVSLMSMSDEVWMRHANPWSGWTRIALFPFWFITLWSWTWIGWWALGPALVLSLWTWLNPRVFPRYQDDRSWITRGVLGERMFVNRQTVPVPQEHVQIAHILTGFALFFLIAAIVGFVTQTFWLALGGWLLSITCKLWFVDRMVWIYENMKDATPEYRSWRTGQPEDPALPAAENGLEGGVSS